MTRWFLLPFALASFLVIPSARAERVHEKWLFRVESAIDDWNYAGLDLGTLGPDGLTFRVEEQGVMYRPLPPDFHEKVDALKIYVGSSTLDEVALLLLRTDAAGEIRDRFRLVFFPTRSTLTEGEYVPLALYRSEITRADTLALSFKGNADAVTVWGVRFIDYSRWEKLLGMWRSFWTFDDFSPYTINIILGPVLVPDIGPLGLYEKTLELMTSVNAYLLVGLSLAGVAFLFSAAWKARRRGTGWSFLRSRVFLRFSTLVAAIWLFYDFRMGLEFLRNVWRDHRQYITAPAATRTFRDRGRFYDFAAFAKGFVADRSAYEVFLPDEYAYFGAMRYLTYPVLPNGSDPVSDTWVVYDRPDITVDPEGRLIRQGEAFTSSGRILGRFDQRSFVFRESVL